MYVYLYKSACFLVNREILTDLSHDGRNNRKHSEHLHDLQISPSFKTCLLSHFFCVLQNSLYSFRQNDVGVFLPELMGFSEAVTKDLKDIGERKEEDEKEEAEFQARVGPRPVSQVISGMLKELETLSTYHKQGVRRLYIAICV